MNAKDLILELKNLANPKKATDLERFFKTGPGQYGEGDYFLGVTVPEQRKLVKKYYKDISLDEITKVIKNEYHECRMTGLLILVEKYKKADNDTKLQICNLYLNSRKYVNNWDLVDMTAGSIVGPLIDDNLKLILLNFAKTGNLWERRIAMMSCFYQIVNGDPRFAFEVIEILKYDKHDLIQKAVGWMLREIGKRCSMQVLINWLDNNSQYKKLPRTTLRYAIEHFEESTRQQYLHNLI